VPVEKEIIKNVEIPVDREVIKEVPVEKEVIKEVATSSDGLKGYFSF